jgi:uncharacterized membrane protein
MVKFQRPAVKSAARNTLSQFPDQARKLVLIHTGVSLLLTIVLSVLDFLLEQKIGTTGGLGGISTRSTLSTIQSLLRYVQFLALPAWNCGYLFALLRLSRQENADERSLLSGFSRFGPVLRLTLLKAAIYFGIGLICVYIASSIFLATPWAKPLLDALEPMVASGEISQEQLLAAMETVALPMVLIFSILFLLACIPVFYMLRVTDFCIMDGQRKGALAALMESLRLTRDNRMALLKLDLSFWWFYLLELLVNLLCYGDLLLTTLGVQLPWSVNVSYFAFLGFYAAAQFLLYAWKKNHICLTYAHTYNTLTTPTGTSTLPTFPWNG